jgi:phage terminase large subunit
LQQLQSEPPPRAVICDHDAEDRATLERHLGMTTSRATKDVSPGLQAVVARLRVAGDGRARLFYLRDSLPSRDRMLEERKRPTCTE